MATIFNTPQAETLTGTDAADTIFRPFDLMFDLGVQDNDRILAMAGSDNIDLSMGEDTIDGGDGRDTFHMGGNLRLNPDAEEGADPSKSAYFQPSRTLVDLAAGTYSALFKPEAGQPDGVAEVFVTGRLFSVEVVMGSAGADTFLGSTGGNYLASRDAYREDFNPGGGNDVVNGRGGLDALRYDLTPDFAASRTTGITVNVAAGQVVDGLGGTDQFTGIEIFIGTFFADVFNGDRKDQEFWGGGNGADTFNGGGGTDLVYFDLSPSQGAVIDLALGTGTNESGAEVVLTSIEVLVGGNANDTFRGSDADEGFRGGWGNDLLEGRGGHDALTGSNGDDTLIGGPGTDTADYSAEFGGGDVVVILAEGRATDSYGTTDSLVLIEDITGGTGLDTLAGDDGRNMIRGMGGDDRLSGGGRADSLYGGDQNDNLFGNDGDDLLDSGTGNNFLDGGAGNDRLEGQSGNDRLFGGSGRDSLTGGAGNDFLRDKQPGSAISGWNRDALLTLLGAGSPPADATLDILRGGAGNDILDGHGLLFGGDQDDVMTGLGYLDGGAGNDRLTEVGMAGGAAVQTILSGGAGNDVLTEGETGLGSVTASYAYAASGVVVNLSGGTARVSASDSDTLVNIGRVQGTRFADTVTGGRGTDGFADLGAGNDVLRGSVTDYFGGNLGEGDDKATLSGVKMTEVDAGAGNDTIIVQRVLNGAIVAGAGNDAINVQQRELDAFGEAYDIFGGLGDDRIVLTEADGAVVYGGAGRDTFVLKPGTFGSFWGDAGSDTFVLQTLASGQKRLSVDIFDFTHDAVQQDRIDLRAMNLTYADLLAKFEVIEYLEGPNIKAVFRNPNNGKRVLELELGLDDIGDLRPEMFLL